MNDLEADERHERISDLERRFAADAEEGGYSEAEAVNACVWMIVKKANGNAAGLMAVIRDLCDWSAQFEAAKLHSRSG